ncbi:MAG: hypothetical protein LQ351_004046 [Letrouitia transgressa]|nr:MAG: hypothetical protein LQ351_004046 [Letrouitia transgressa]
MPTLGTPKHFRCVSVRGIDAEQVLVVYSNNDWTGDSCYIDGNGVWGTPNEDEANSIDVLRSDTGNFKRCYFSGGSGDGEQKEIPKLPGTTTQQGTTAQPSNSAGQGSCINPDGADPGDSGVCVDLAQKFPDVNDTYYYSNGDSTASGGDRRRRSRILLKRVDEFRAPNARDIAATKGILAYIQHGLSNGLPAGNLQVVDQSHGTTLRDFMTGNSQQAWAGDHIMELQLIKQFFSTAQGAIFQVVLNQMLNCVTTNSIVIDAVNNACNLIGVAVRINGLKGRLFRVNSNGQPSNVDFALNYRGELLALVNYMTYLQPNFLDIVRRVGNIMDVIWHQNNGVQGQQPSGLWSQYANAAWQGALDRLNGALNGNTVYKDQALFSQDYANANLRT